MKKLGILLAAAAASVLLPSVSNAACTTFGQVTRVTVTSTSASVWVRASSTTANTYVFSTSNISQLTAALTAQASHQQVRVDGNAASCPGAVGGTIIGGAVVNIYVSL